MLWTPTIVCGACRRGVALVAGLSAAVFVVLLIFSYLQFRAFKALFLLVVRDGVLSSVFKSLGRADSLAAM